MSERNINIVAVLGSVRPNNYTAMALKLTLDEFKNHRGVNVQLFDPAIIHLDPPGIGGDSPDPARMREAVENATGLILATPEYHGSFSSVMKLAIENLGFPSVMSGKPVSLLGVAAGSIGAIKSLESLRGVCSHVGAIVLPGFAREIRFHRSQRISTAQLSSPRSGAERTFYHRSCLEQHPTRCL